MQIDRVRRRRIFRPGMTALGAALALITTAWLWTQDGEGAALSASRHAKPIVSGVTAQDATPTAPAPAAPGGEIGSLATALIWQPPTRTPRSTSTPGGPTPSPAARTVPADSPFRPERLWQAAWNGVGMALAVFGCLAIYGLIRAAWRGEARAWWWEFRRDVINPLLDNSHRRREK